MTGLVQTEFDLFLPNVRPVVPNQSKIEHKNQELPFLHSQAQCSKLQYTSKS